MVLLMLCERLTLKFLTYRVAVSENGWIDDFLALEWFEKVFIPFAKARNLSGKPILLIYDGHGSHTAHKIRKHAVAAGFHCYCLPAHTTHKLQPLDVGVFGPLQRAYTTVVDDLTAKGETVTKYNVIETYMKARTDAFKPETILSAFEKTGLRPWNPDVFSEEDFGPSFPTSTQAHYPDTYPRPDPTETLILTEPVGLDAEPLEDDEDDDDASSGHSSSSELSGPSSVCESEDGEDGTVAERDIPSDLYEASLGLLGLRTTTPTRTPTQTMVGLSPSPTSSHGHAMTALSIPASPATSVPASSSPSASFFTSSSLSSPPPSPSRPKVLPGRPTNQKSPYTKTLRTDSRAKLLDRIELLEKENSRIQSHCMRLRGHAIIMGRQNEDLQQQLNTKRKEPRKRKELTTEARLLTSEEGMRLCEEEEQEREAEAAAKERKKAERATKKIQREEEQAAKKVEIARKKEAAREKKRKEELEKAARLRAREEKRKATEAEKARKEEAKAERERAKADKEKESENAAQETAMATKGRKRSNTSKSTGAGKKKSRTSSIATSPEQENDAPIAPSASSATQHVRVRPKPRKVLTDTSLNIATPPTTSAPLVHRPPHSKDFFDRTRRPEHGTSLPEHSDEIPIDPALLGEVDVAQGADVEMEVVGLMIGMSHS